MTKSYELLLISQQTMSNNSWEKNIFIKYFFGLDCFVCFVEAFKFNSKTFSDNIYAILRAIIKLPTQDLIGGLIEVKTIYGLFIKLILKVKINTVN